jgi:hypothetical protein
MQELAGLQLAPQLVELLFGQGHAGAFSHGPAIIIWLLSLMHGHGDVKMARARRPGVAKRHVPAAGHPSDQRHLRLEHRSV